MNEDLAGAPLLEDVQPPLDAHRESQQHDSAVLAGQGLGIEEAGDGICSASVSTALSPAPMLDSRTPRC
jgi:hypothetical protein